MSMEVLNRHWNEIASKENYLNAAVGHKFHNGKDTGVPAIVVYVKKKVAPANLTAEHLIPSEIEGIPTDVVELTPTSWKAEQTVISRLRPEEQRRLLGLTKDPNPPKACMAARIPVRAPIGASEWSGFGGPVQDQSSCGACTAFDVTGVWETKLRLVADNPALPIKLSEAHLFFCSGGSCQGGNSIANVLNQAMKGVCLESCLPYRPQDQVCGAGICQNWWTDAKRLAGWAPVTDPTAIKVLLDQEPLSCTMAVHQSFFNYSSGVYKNLGPSDPIVGYHAIGNLGYSDALGADLIRNSWNTGWGQGCIVNGQPRPGYCWIAYGELDQERQQLLLDGPVPPPDPPYPLNIKTTSLPDGITGIPYQAKLQATGGNPPYTWSGQAGSLPNGIILNADGGIIGSPVTPGVYTGLFTVTDSAQSALSIVLYLTIRAPSPCKVGNAVAGTLNLYSKIAGRKGRFYYLNNK
ncbi:MAG: C1 family peptidase [Dehalococcoidia bacterium]